MASIVDREVQAGGETKDSSRGRLSGWAVVILSVMALGAVTAAAVALLWPTSEVRAPELQGGTSSLYTPQEQIVMRLVASGYIPRETLNGGIYRIKSLVNQGLIPPETLNPYSPPVEPLYTEQEQTVMRLVAGGLIPKETLDGEPYRTKSLINQGLVPREAASTARDRSPQRLRP